MASPYDVPNLCSTLNTTGGTSTASLNATGVVKAMPGKLCKILVTVALSAAAITIYDNAAAASGTIIGYIPASSGVGTLLTFDMPAENGIYASFGGTGTVTFSYY